MQLATQEQIDNLVTRINAGEEVGVEVDQLSTLLIHPDLHSHIVSLENSFYDDFLDAIQAVSSDDGAENTVYIAIRMTSELPFILHNLNNSLQASQRMRCSVGGFYHIALGEEVDAQIVVRQEYMLSIEEDKDLTEFFIPKEETVETATPSEEDQAPIVGG